MTSSSDSDSDSEGGLLSKLWTYPRYIGIDWKLKTLRKEGIKHYILLNFIWEEWMDGIGELQKLGTVWECFLSLFGILEC